MKVLAVDPGVDTGWCLVESGAVVDCGLGPSGWPRAPMAILERPQVYRQAQQKGDPNDLITLAIQIGRYVERLETAGTKTALVLPNTWKGQVPKDVHHRRIVAKLSPDEAARVASRLEHVAESKRHNVLDAVGLAKWAAANPSFLARA